ncbi:MAG: alpha/beta hydrolase [Gammaproteobacteria bacterium]
MARPAGVSRTATAGRWRDAIAVLDELSSGPQLLVGSSMGGWIMLLAALARPERIAGLLGIAAAADFTEDLLWRRFDVATRNQLMDEGILYHPSAYGDTPYAITLNLIEEGRQHLLLGQTIPLACPLRLLHGMEDRDVPWQTSLRIVERWAGGDARLTLIKDGEHRLSRAQDLALITATVVELSRLHATEQS